METAFGQVHMKSDKMCEDASNLLYELRIILICGIALTRPISTLLYLELTT